MKRRRISLGIGMVLALCLAGTSAGAVLVNGDFSNGLDGWTANYDFGWSSAEPGRETTVVDGYAELLTQGESGSVAALSSLWQWFEVPADAAWLTFDVWFDATSISGPPGLTFLDYLEVSYLDDDDWDFDRYFLGLDTYGPYDPNTGSPLGLEDLGGGWLRYEAGIADLAGRSGALYFDLWNDLDGYDSQARIDNVAIRGAAPIPEPGTLVLLGTGLIGVVGVRRRRRR